MLRQTNQIQAVLTRVDVTARIRKHIEFATSSSNLLHIAFELLQHNVVGCDHDHRHAGIDQCQRAVLEFAGGVRLGVDVADFFEFERALEGDWVVQAAAQKQGVPTATERLGPSDDLWLERKNRLQGHWQVAKGFQSCGLSQIRESSAQLGQDQRQQVEGDQLGGKRFGRSDANLGARAGDKRHFALSNECAGLHVADG